MAFEPETQQPETAQPLAGSSGFVPDEFATTPGGAATGVRRPATKPLLSPAGEALGAVAGSGVSDAIMSYFAPQLLSGAARVAGAFPVTAGMSPFLDVASSATRAAGPVARTVSGAIGGLVGETFGQAADAAKVPWYVGEPIRFVAGALAPGTAEIIHQVFMKKLPTNMEASFLKVIARKVNSVIAGTSETLDEQEAAYLNKLTAQLRGGAPSTAPAEGVDRAFKAGAVTKLAVGDTEAQTIMGRAQDAIAQEMDNLGRGQAKAGEVQQRVLSRGKEALGTAQQQRLNIGQDLDPSDIGNPLREVITTRNQKLIDARNAAFKETERYRDEAVAAKVAAGQNINSGPEFDAMVRELEATIPSQSLGTQPALKRILSELKAPGTDALGDKPLSFEAVDQVRRQLGQVFKGEAPEGYAGIDAKIARVWYDKLSNLQKNYAGPEQVKLLEDYGQAKGGLEVFQSKSGKKFTAVDRYDDEKFQTDPASLPKTFFKTQQSVADLIELTGDRAAAVQAGKHFATGELRNLTEPQVREWMVKNRDWLSAMPEVRESVTKYANQLGYGELVSRSAERAAERAGKISTMQEAQTTQRTGQISSEAKSGAAAAVKQRGDEAVSLAGDKFPVERVQSLLESGSRQQWALAGPAIHGYPGGKEIMADAVRQYLADKVASGKAKDITELFTKRIGPGLEQASLMQPQETAKIAAQLNAIEHLNIPESERLKAMDRLFLQAFAAYTSSAGARATTSVVNLIPGSGLENAQPGPRPRANFLSPIPPEARAGLQSFPGRYGP